MFRFTIFFLLLFPKLLFGQTDDFVNLEKTGHDNYKMVYTQYYDGQSLWGYMDGGADLYLEYGFEGLLVQEINYKGTTIKCEIFKMKDALSAFGIFSVQRHNCKLTKEIDANHCINNYQVQLVRGDYYLSLINQAGDSTAQDASVEVANWFTKTIEKKDVAFPDHPLFKEKSQHLIYLKGEISLGNVYPQALNYLDNNSSFSMWLSPSEKKNSPATSLISFENAEGFKKYAAAAFPGINFDTTAERKLKNGGSLLAIKLENNTIIQLEGRVGKEIKKILGLN